MPTILDFQIQPLSAEHYSLTVCERGSSQPLASATFSHRVDFLTDFSVDRLNASTKDAAERFDELQKLGRELYQKLFPPAVEQVWREYKQRSEFLILCLRFAEGAKKLEVLPWETMHDGVEFIAAGTKTTLTRLPLGIAPPRELPPIPRPLKLFGFFASPLDSKDHERLNTEREQEILLEAINDPAAEGRISADFEDEAKLEILERSLRAELAGSGGYHILHFTGHGISPRDGGGLLLEDAHGKKLPASIADVMRAIQSGQDGNAKLRLAVISGCQTARTLHTQGFNDLARELLRQRVPAVIAMQFSISDEGGLKFAEVLYREIAKGVELERAVHAARRVLLEDQRFFINNDALATVLLAADGACLQTTEAQSQPPQAEPGATYLGDRLDPLAHGFYGRRREYRQIRDALLHQDQRAVIIHGVIIHGIGGIGKTALLTYAINRLRPRFKDVMSFDCRRAALAPETILLELHRYFATQGMPQLQSLIGHNVPPERLAEEIAQVLMQLTEWPLLIVFDNFESQLDERRAFLNEDLRVFLTTLLRATAAGSRFLFTTRVLFDLDGERLGNLQQLPLGDLSRPEALMLMQKLPNLAQAAHRDKLAVLEKFSGHPYALVTLDRHCSHQPLDQALQDIDSLQSELREFLAIELNYRRLSEDARELLNRLAAFRNQVPFAAANWVMGKKTSYAVEYLESLDRSGWPDEMIAMSDDQHITLLERMLPERRQASDLTLPITELIELGLLMTNEDTKQAGSFSIHNLVRSFCIELQASEYWRNRLRDAAAFFINQTKLMKPEDKSQVAIWQEMEAVELLMEAEDFEAATDLLQNVQPLMDRWGLNLHVERLYVRALSKADRRVTAAILHNHAIILEARGEYETALEKLKQSLKISEELGEYRGTANSHHAIAGLHFLRGDYELALEQFERLRNTMERYRDRRGMADAQLGIGMIYRERGEHEEALSQFEQVLQISKELGNLDGVASSRLEIGMIHRERREYEAALSQYEQALRVMEELGDRRGMAQSMARIGMVYQDREEHEKALSRYEQALRIMEELGDRKGVAGLLNNIGGIYQHRGEYEVALSQFERSLKINSQVRDEAGMARGFCNVGKMNTELGNYEQAFLQLLLARSICLEMGLVSVGVVDINLMLLREQWGTEAFDIWWRVTTKGDVPDWLSKPLVEYLMPRNQTEWLKAEELEPKVEQQPKKTGLLGWLEKLIGD